MSLLIGSNNNFYIQAVSLRYIGINIPRGQESCVRVRWFFWLLYLVDLFRVLCSGADSLRHSSDLDLTTKILATFVQDILSLWKAAVLILTRENILKLVNEIHIKSMQAEQEELLIVLKELKKDRVLSTTYYVACISTAVACIVAPVGESIVLTYMHNTTIFILPFEGRFFIDYSKIHNYILIVVLSTISLYFAINACVAVDSIYSWFVNSISAHFQRLELKLQYATAVGADSDKLRDCIRYHQWIIRVSEEFATLFRPIIFVEFSLNSLQLCLIAFRMVLGFSLHSTPFLIIFLGAVIIQLIIYCYAGQKLENESERVASAMHDCMQLSSRKNRCSLLIILIRAQHTSRLDGIFFTVNYELFIWVVRTAASYLTMLKSLG